MRRSVLLQIFSGIAPLAVDDKQPAVGPGPDFSSQGTPEEQAACAPDFDQALSRCYPPDTFRVLACLQQNRQNPPNLLLKCWKITVNKARSCGENQSSLWQAV